MASDLSNQEVLNKMMDLPQSLVTDDAFTVSGTVPSSISHAEIKRVITCSGITIGEFSSLEFDFNALMTIFANYCKDFNKDLSTNTPSYALQFSEKMIFGLGKYIRTEKKSEGAKAIRFKFPYKTGSDGIKIKVVIVTTFRGMAYKKMEDQDKLIITFKQAALLSVVTFLKAVKFAYSQDQSILLTPLCGAVFSREAVPSMAKDLNIEIIEVIKVINASTCSGGEYLPDSDMACAIIGIICGTKRIKNPAVRNQMITKLIKQYAAKNKVYSSDNFSIYAKYALGGVPKQE